ncbi:hypothetical protein L210DRAFT_3515276 [Boletus edulis BED1]|uniref:MRG domain-containing protein n=1 Tax=Boletus edulis BED1 TaxID=1328754 RepID=A0AAD4C7W1_BOLED|nr:hypothetical protein L210DRAFT_3515276 [Boletus edulis BED1]
MKMNVPEVLKVLFVDDWEAITKNNQLVSLPRTPNVIEIKVGQEKDMSSIYGAEHLLRMLVSLPQMVVSSTMDAESIGLVKDYVNELLSFLVAERDRLFLSEYQSASLQYQNISRS